MTRDIGAMSHHSADGQNLRIVHSGIAFAAHQKNGATKPTTANPMS